MHAYAQTNIQLFNQLHRCGYSNTDLNLVRDAYELAMVHFTGRFAPSGKSFIAHVVGTASILASHRLSPQVVAAGLIHNIYQNGDFGDGRRSISKARRKKIAIVVGAEVEEWIARFPGLSWESQTIQLARDNPDKLDLVDRNILLILFADHLEHLLDYDILYYDYAIAQSYIAHSKIAAEIAERLGFPSLATELIEAIQAAQSAELPVNLPAHKTRSGSSLVAPKSCRERRSVALRRLLVHAAHSSRLRIRKLRRLCAELAKTCVPAFWS